MVTKVCCSTPSSSLHTALSRPSHLHAQHSNEFMLVTGCSQGTVRVWDIRRSGGAACLASLDNRNQGQTQEARTDPTEMLSTSISKAHYGPTTALHFPQRIATTGQYLVSAGGDSTMELWDMTTFKNMVPTHTSTCTSHTASFASLTHTLYHDCCYSLCATAASTATEPTRRCWPLRPP